MFIRGPLPLSSILYVELKRDKGDITTPKMGKLGSQFPLVSVLFYGLDALGDKSTGRQTTDDWATTRVGHGLFFATYPTQHNPTHQLTHSTHKHTSTDDPLIHKPIPN